jgi:catalase
MVPGIDVSNDKLLQARLFACTDAARYRIGTNFMQIPINCPYTTRVSTTQRDGQMAVNGNLVPFYVPPVTEKKENESTHPVHFAHNLKLSGVTRHVVKMGEDDYVQPGVFWRNVLKEDERKRVAERMVHSLLGVKKQVAARVIAMVKLADDQWAKMLEDGLATKARV